ncbi:MAG: ubiquinol-cytochrome C reductase [Microbacterium sp.]|jgi:ubiquinol-cytochrome c reductase iron-sulfur subunit|uniref:Cytochrome bc1 complex Rieske iron-sulfur subunit n=2 Tax=Microbacterium ginsengisoli TaxID=400772 RepID=A0A0F0LV30_9MICO|nr:MULTISPECIES: Rieske 2Fe-2S domain-containing protein [Microbacterium]MAL05562.1 ubiquinol-cytochrome C reductase [Microbacterium sp.]MCK9915070.1 Rieske 2Fe-2S domain-containing protein [Microbacteriaceae bacterium K1510]KJL36973.1 Arsenite oxidase subunit AioB precursor [Microbacterium ginsengisoli]KQR90505.1 ubiquinol-cytochrome C reductase [Microbacterium sp. Leaf347]KQR91356.1 ubiquinol-cytochrome C reductase [Microbacterium sp. Leaf351]
MAHEVDPLEHERASWKPSSGLAVAETDPVTNPGLPPHRERMTDKDPAALKRAVRTVYILFYLSLAGSIWAIAAYMLFPIEDHSLIAVRDNNLFVGLGIALALLAIGIGAIHWSKAIMSDKEHIEPRHATRGRDTTREGAVAAFAAANEESGFGRRAMIRNSLFAAVIASILPGITLFRGLAPQDVDPVEALSHTMWKQGMRLAHDPSGVPIKASDVTIGSAFHVIPEPLAQLSHADGYLDEKAKAIVLLMRLPLDQLHEADDRKSWSYDGIVAYSKVCTHVGCPVALYEQLTHHLLCPCHQSQFDVSNGAAVIFGPAARPLPQLPIAVDSEGYIVAQSDFHEPVGPSFWERH